MSADETYARRLRERYGPAAPEFEVNPDVLVARGRRRRAGFRVLMGGIAVVAVAGVVLGGLWLAPNRGSVAPGPAATEPAAPPAEPEGAEATILFSAVRVPPGADLALAFVSHGSAELIGGVAAEVERWDGAAWQPAGSAKLCVQSWNCVGHVTRDGDQAVEAIGVPVPAGGASDALYLSTEGLEPGWYRLGSTLHDMTEPPPAGGRRQLVARGTFEVAADAPEPPALTALDAPTIEVSPSVLTPAGGSLRLYPVVPPRADGSQTAEDVDAAVAGLSETAAVERWTDGAWVAVAQVALAPADDGNGWGRTAQVPPLPVGDYRLVRTGPQGEHAGGFWVHDPGPQYVLFEPDEPVPAWMAAFADRLAASTADPAAPKAFRERAPLASCGAYLVDQGVDGATLPWSCLAASQAIGAELVVVRPTTEGDPFVLYYRVGPGIDGVQGFEDATADRFGSQGWAERACRLSDREPLCD